MCWSPLTKSVAGGLGGAIFGGNGVLNAGLGQALPGLPGYPNTGAGGTGAAVNQVAATEVLGGNGGSGFCIVTEYCWADSAPGTPGCDCDCGQARVAFNGCNEGW